jgi:uncharacterized membrane protein HdeD (DUF308 family)
LFYIVPVIAPAMGKFILIITIGMGFLYSGVHQYFGFVVLKRQPETLSVENKKNSQQRFYRRI